MSTSLLCWCNNKNLIDFSTDYKQCSDCHTLISKVGFRQQKTFINDDEDFYGKNYWLEHQTNDLHFPDIFKRSRSDLSERCLYWLRTLLEYKLPPAQFLELGSAHGGFLALLSQCGYQVAGLELSPWIADYAKKTFDIPMLIGAIEEQHIYPNSLDIIAIMDVLEHLPDPIGTLKACFQALKQDGILVIQTPNYPLDTSYSKMVEKHDPFLQMLQPDEHLYLFNQRSVQTFLQQLCDTPLHIQFEKAIFAQYDMFLIVSRQPFTKLSKIDIENYLSSSRNTRIIQAMLDLKDQCDESLQRYQTANVDRIERLNIIQQVNDKHPKLGPVLNCTTTVVPWLVHGIQRSKHNSLDPADKAAERLSWG